MRQEARLGLIPGGPDIRPTYLPIRLPDLMLWINLVGGIRLLSMQNTGDLRRALTGLLTAFALLGPDADNQTLLIPYPSPPFF